MASSKIATPAADAASLIVNEVTLVGSRCGRFESAIELLATRKVDVEPMISQVLPLTAGTAALEAAGEPGVLKVIVENRTDG